MTDPSRKAGERPSGEATPSGDQAETITSCPPLPPPVTPPWPFAPDAVFAGRYRIDRLLGRGGMGSVWLAHDLRLDRPVALKVPQLDSDRRSTYLERFYREARAAAQLHHPNLCAIHDVGDHQGLPFLTMAYLEGQPLSQWLKERKEPLRPAEAVELVRAVARALAAAHRRGVIHRDLKPANIMMTADGPVVMDFGIARRSSADEEPITQEGVVLGTPAYMAPEQVRGEVAAIGPACDVYSLGVIFYELLAGRAPFVGAPLAILAQVLTQAPPPPSRFRPDLDPHLVEVCLRAMAREKADRMASMEEFIEALAPFSAGGTSEALPACTSARPPSALATFDELVAAHADIVGRQEVVEQVRRFIREHDRGLLVIQAEPGKGKTALVAHLIERVFKDYQPRPVYFFYRRTAGITNPDLCVRSLYQALCEVHALESPHPRMDQVDAETAYLQFLGLLTGTIASNVSPDKPQLILVDGLDEAEPTAAGKTGFARIPENLPAGVFCIATTRPVHDRASLARRANVCWLDLDAPDRMSYDLRDGEEYVHRRLEKASPNTVAEIARAGGGNFLVLRLLCQHAHAALSPEEITDFLRRLSTDGGQDQLGFIYADFWEHLTGTLSRQDGQLLCDVLGVLAFAHAPLSAYMMAGILNLRSGDWSFALRRLAEYLSILSLTDGRDTEPFYRLYHESFAEFVRSRIAVDRLHYLNLLADYAHAQITGARSGGIHEREYALRFAATHLREAERWDDLDALLVDPAYLEGKVEAGMVVALLDDFKKGTHLISKMRCVPFFVEEAIRTDVQFLARRPELLFQSLWNRCWWYDSPEAAGHYVQPEGGWPDDGPPWNRQATKLCDLLASWRERKRMTPGCRWLRSLRPPEVHLGTAQRSIIRGHSAKVTGAAFSPDGRWLASASGDHTVRIWDLASGKERACLRGHTNQVWSVAFRPDGKQLASAGWDGTVRLWDVETGEEVLCRRVLGKRLWSVAFSPDGRTFAVGSDSHKVRLWDAETGKELERFRGHEGPVWQVAFSPDGRTLATASDDETIRLWDVEGARELARLRKHRSEVMGVAFSPDGTRLVSAGWDGIIRVWELGKRRLLRELGNHGRRITCVAFSPDGSQVAAASGATVRVWDAATGMEAARLQGHTDCVWNVAFSPDGSRLVSSSWDWTLRLWDPRGSELFIKLKDHAYTVESLAFSRDGRWLASGSSDWTVRIWSAETGLQVTRLLGPKDRVHGVAFSPDGLHLASVSADTNVRVWTLAAQKESLDATLSHTFTNHEKAVWSLAFSSDGRFLATGSDDRTIRVWDLERGEQCSLLVGHDGWIGGLAFSPDGKQLTSGSSDRTVRIWDWPTGKELTRHHSGERSVLAVAFNPDANEIFYETSDRVIHAWHIDNNTTRVIQEGVADVIALAHPARYPYHAVSRRGDETTIHDAATGEAIAWYPASLSRLAAHPDGRTWAGAHRNHLSLFRLEEG